MMNFLRRMVSKINNCLTLTITSQPIATGNGNALANPGYQTYIVHRTSNIVQQLFKQPSIETGVAGNAAPVLFLQPIQNPIANCQFPIAYCQLPNLTAKKLL